MNFEVSPYFLITNNAEKLRIRLEEIFNANTVYIQRVKDADLMHVSIFGNDLLGPHMNEILKISHYLIMNTQLSKDKIAI